jgi:hypothetical protein
MKTRFFLLTAPLFILFSSAFSETCNISPVEEEKILSMPYDDFDQKNNGWRQYAKLGCYHEMGVLIDKYLDQKKTKLTDGQIIGITWHAGQMYALNNE